MKWKKQQFTIFNKIEDYNKSFSSTYEDILNNIVNYIKTLFSTFEKKYFSYQYHIFINKVYKRNNKTYCFINIRFHKWENVNKFRVSNHSMFHDFHLFSWVRDLMVLSAGCEFRDRGSIPSECQISRGVELGQVNFTIASVLHLRLSICYLFIYLWMTNQ